jgi:tetratricopeptide (TPR) repeat protein
MRPTMKSQPAIVSINKNSLLLAPMLWMLLSAGIPALSGCATNKHINDNAMTIAADSDALADGDKESVLKPEFIYRYLVGEIAGQRGDIGTSGAIFYDLARTERDARLAERAAKIAAYGNITNLAVPAIQLWAELDPDSTEAQQAMTEMLIATGKLDETRPYLSKLLSKEETRASGFLYLNTLLNRSPDKAAVLELVQFLAQPYPDSAEAQFAIAQAAWVANKDDIALAAINKAGTLHAGWDIAALLKGQILYRKSPQAAIDYYYAFLKSHPQSNEVHINLAKLLVNQKQFEAAKKEYPLIIEQSKSSSPKNTADVTAVVGLLSYQSADYISAQNYFQQALAMDFKDADQLYLYMGQTSEKLDQNEAAADWYKKIALGPRYLEAQLSLANLIARTQSADKAIEILDELADLNTEQQIIVIQSQASILVRAKRDQEAFDLLEKAVKNLPNTPELVYDYALAAERLKKFDLMESELRRAIAEKPDFAAAYNALGYSFADRNIKLNEAIKLIEKALELSPNDHYMLDSLGWAHFRKGNLDKAIQYLQEAYNINPDPEIAAHLGEALWHKGQHEQAKKIWNDALSIHPDNEVLITTANKFKS